MNNGFKTAAHLNTIATSPMAAAAGSEGSLIQAKLWGLNSTGNRPHCAGGAGRVRV